MEVLIGKSGFLIVLSKRFVGGEGIFYPKFHGICSVVESIPGGEMKPSPKRGSTM